MLRGIIAVKLTAALTAALAVASAGPLFAAGDKPHLVYNKARDTTDVQTVPMKLDHGVSFVIGWSHDGGPENSTVPPAALAAITIFCKTSQGIRHLGESMSQPAEKAQTVFLRFGSTKQTLPAVYEYSFLVSSGFFKVGLTWYETVRVLIPAAELQQMAAAKEVIFQVGDKDDAPSYTIQTQNMETLRDVAALMPPGSAVGR